MRMSLPGLLCLIDLVPQREGHPLGLGPDPDVPRHWRLMLGQVLLQAHIGQGVLAEDRLGVQVGRHKATLAGQGLEIKAGFSENCAVLPFMF